MNIMAKVDLVFRQIGERTSKVALDLAIKNIKPDAIHIMDDIRPFSECVNRMLRIQHQCDYVVYVDADCLILEDMRDYIDRCNATYVDCYVTDRFRGRIHCGVHITSADLVKRMAEIEAPAHDLEYFLRPESRLRGLVMRPALLKKQFHNFDILHDHFQYYHHIFAKYALRELRSRKEELIRLTLAMARWPAPGDRLDDFTIARHAVAYAREHCPADRSADEVDQFIQELPQHAAREMARLGVTEKGPLTQEGLDHWLERHPERPLYGAKVKKPKVFGVGLSRTATRSLTGALQIIGYDTVHYPTDQATYDALTAGRYRLSLLDHYDGITDITAAPFFAQFDQAYPGSKFILTVREKEGWLRSCENHWDNAPSSSDTHDPDLLQRFNVRRFFRAATYGCHEFSRERFSWVYDQHVKNVLDYFKDRPDQLLVLNVCSGEGFEKLAPFLGLDTPCLPFPHKGAEVTRRATELRAVASAPDAPPCDERDGSESRRASCAA